jgi:hypothetical protein
LNASRASVPNQDAASSDRRTRWRAWFDNVAPNLAAGEMVDQRGMAARNQDGE